MSNTPKLNGGEPRGDMGIGLCLACLSGYRQAVTARDQAHEARKPVPPMPPYPAFAITLAPSPVPVPGPGGQIVGIAMVALPSCWDHLMTGGSQQQKRPLLVAGGMP